ncbi:MAG: hypothetical protein AMJ70_02225 [Dehalococcoidia bacterium SG8_51_3]|nr:MAG: hypothetical protein AMJ70_02225 [Dehalococcoidia bacterium SG8_51_3]
MTHTLHRQGTKESLDKDYIFLCMAAKGYNEDGADEKMREFLRIMMRHNPVNAGDMRSGNMFNSKMDDILSKVSSTSIVHGVFTDSDTATNVLKELKDADLGMSVVVSGPFDSVDCICEKAGLKPHSLDYSGGIWGNTKKLPTKEVQEVTTMCGHAMVASNLVKSLVDDIKAKRTTAEEAGKELAKQCACGIFNPARAAELMQKMASND